MTRRVAILFDNFGPYHIARLTGAALAGLDVLGVEFRTASRVYDWMKPDVPKFLRHASLGLDSGDKREKIYDALDRVVGPFAPDAIAITGWASPEDLIALAWARRRALPAVIMSETNLHDFRRVSLGEWVKQSVLSNYMAGLVGGNSAKAYLVSLGMPAETVFLGYDVVDNEYFETSAEGIRACGVLPGIGVGQLLDPCYRDRYFLASARFIEKKNLHRLLDAYSLYRTLSKSNNAWPLVILGDGALREQLESKRADLGLDGSVHMPGFRQYCDLPAYYGTAGAFVHVSTTEQWGLVVNEAMASGLPVAVSRRCGCAEMLVAEGENGFTFDPFDVEAIAKVLQRIAIHPDRLALGEASRQRIREWGPGRFGTGMTNAVDAAIRRRYKVSGLLPTIMLHTVAVFQTRRP